MENWLKNNKVKIIIKQTPSHFDSDDIRFVVDGNNKDLKGYGYITKDDGSIGLIRCPACNQENYAANVVTGICSACGFSVHDDNIEKP